MLDFGCGHGYVAAHIAVLPLMGLRVYACDTDEECLDVLWGRIAQRSLSNLTAFHLPNYSQVSLPGWLPALDYIFCSFSMSAIEHADIAIPAIVRQVQKGTQFLFVEWDPRKTHPVIDRYIPASRRIAPEDFKRLISVSGLTLQHEESGRQPFYVMRAIKT